MKDKRGEGIKRRIKTLRLNIKLLQTSMSNNTYLLLAITLIAH